MEKNQKGYILLTELLAVCGILLVLLAMSVPSIKTMRQGIAQRQAVQRVKEFTAAESYYNNQFHDGYSSPEQLFGNGIATVPTCDAPVIYMGGIARSDFTIDGYRFVWTRGDTNAALGSGCSTPGATTYTLTADPVNPLIFGAQHFFTDQSGQIHFANGRTAISGDLIWTQ